MQDVHWKNLILPIQPSSTFLLQYAEDQQRKKHYSRENTGAGKCGMHISVLPRQMCWQAQMTFQQQG